MKRANVSFYIVKNPISKIQKEKGGREKNKKKEKEKREKIRPSVWISDSEQGKVNAYGRKRILRILEPPPNKRNGS